MNSLNSLLYSHFNGFDSIEHELKDIKKFLFDKSDSYVLDKISAKVDLQKLKGNLSYIITDGADIDLSEYNDYLLSKQLLNKQDTLVAIRKKLKIKQVTLENVIDAGIKKSLRNLSFFINLKSLNFSKTSYHMLKYSEQIALLLIYNSFIGNEYIILDQLISSYKPKELEILFNLILPKTAKISKIVVIDKIIYPSFLNNFYTYVYKNEEIMELETNHFAKETNKYVVNYYEDNLLKTKIFNKDDDQIINYLRNKKIKNILSDYSLELKDIEEYKG
jgi:hypothetical protein